MKYENSPFTFSQAFGIQARDISRWAKVLTPEAYMKLIDEVLKRNAEQVYESPYDVLRGQDIDSIVHRITMN